MILFVMLNNYFFLIQSNTFISYEDGTPVSYQLWNNYLVKNKNYRATFLPNIKYYTLKSVPFIEYTKKSIQPQLTVNNDCVIMLINILAEPDWINIPCDQKLFAFVICQNMLHKNKNESQRKCVELKSKRNTYLSLCSIIYNK